MNARGAIELAEAKIKRLENMLQVGIERNLLDTIGQNEIKRDIEAEIIILESAKLFHKYSVTEMFSKLKSGLGEEEANKIKTIYGVPIENVGIEVDAE